MTGSRLNNRNFNRENHLRGQLDQPRGPTPPPVHPEYPPEQRGDDEEDTKQHPDQDWYYGEHAGGMVLPYRKYYGEKMNTAPLTYLKWCYNLDRLTHATAFRGAFERYYHGLRQWVRDGNYGEIVVPVGHTYRNMKLKDCRDKAWMIWLRDWTRRFRPEDLEKHDVFFLAIDEWIKHPRHQDAIRDIGQSLASKKYEDDRDLEQDEEYVDEDADELDAKGNLKNFIVPDDVSDSNEDYNDNEGSSSDGSESEASAEETDEEGTRSALPTPPPESAKRRRREISVERHSDSESKLDEAPSSPSKTRSVSLRSGKLVTFGDCLTEVLPTPPPENSRKRQRLSTPIASNSGASHQTYRGSPSQKKIGGTAANPQLVLPTTPQTPGRYKRLRHTVVILSDDEDEGDDDDDDDDDDIPLDQIYKTPSKSSSKSAPQTSSKRPTYSKVGFDGTPMERLARKLFD